MNARFGIFIFKRRLFRRWHGDQLRGQAGNVLGVKRRGNAESEVFKALPTRPPPPRRPPRTQPARPHTDRPPTSPAHVLLALPAPPGQYQTVYNVLSFSLACMMASTIFFWSRVSAIKEK